MPPDVGVLARAARVLTPLTEIWQQRPEETAEEYGCFLAWLHAGPARGAPPAEAAEAARAHEWAERALAYERESSQLAAAASGTTPEQAILANLTRVVDIEAAKLLKQAASSHQPVVSVKDLTAIVGLIQDLHDRGKAAGRGGAGAASADLSQYTTEEKRKILDAQMLLQKGRK